MAKTILFLFGLSLLISFKPGEPVATLKCKSESGRTFFDAVLPSCSYLESAEFSIDSSKYSFAATDRSAIIFDPENKIFTVYLETRTSEPKNRKFIKFWALPNTFKKIKSEKGSGSQFHDVYEFRAKIYGTEPRAGFEPNTKTIELVCTLDYEL